MTAEEFLDEFKRVAETYNLRLQQSQADEQARWQLAAEEANKLLLNGLTHNLLVRALEQYQRSTPAEQSELLAALQIDFNRGHAPPTTSLWFGGRLVLGNWGGLKPKRGAPPGPLRVGVERVRYFVRNETK